MSAVGVTTICVLRHKLASLKHKLAAELFTVSALLFENLKFIKAMFEQRF